MKFFKKVFMSVLIICGGLFLVACTENTEKKLSSYGSNQEIIEIMFYCGPRLRDENINPDLIEILSSDKLEEFINEVDSWTLVIHHKIMDYYWGNKFFIQITYLDNSFIRYDGTKISYYVDGEEQLSNFLEIKDVEFWATMKTYFDSIDLNEVFEKF